MYKNSYKTFVQACFMLMPFFLLGQYNWSTTTFPTKRVGMASAYANGKVLYAGGFYPSATTILESDKVDIYDTATNTWTTETLPIPHTGMAAAVVGDKIIFAGGQSNQQLTTKMHIYNATTGAWVHKDMPDSRRGLSAAVVGDRVFFGGGTSGNLYFNNNVMVYNVATDIWETNLVMTEMRQECAMASVGTKVIFAYGKTPDIPVVKILNIEIYDTATQTWEKVANTQWREQIKTATVGNKAFFIGGYTGNFTPSKTINIYNVTTNAWTTKNLTVVHDGPGIGVLNNRLLIAGGADGSTQLSTVEVLNTSNNTFEAQINLSLARSEANGVSSPTQVFFAGGYSQGSGTSQPTTDLVDILSTTTGTFTPVAFGTLMIAPTLANDQVQISTDEVGEYGAANIEVLNTEGRIVPVYFDQKDLSKWTIRTAELPKGIYFVKLTQAHKSWVGRFVKIN